MLELEFGLSGDAHLSVPESRASASDGARYRRVMAVSISLTPVPEEPGEPADDRSPARGKAAFNCPVCGAFAHQVWHELMLDTGTPTDDGIEPPVPGMPFPTVSRWRQAQCTSCGKFSTWRRDRLVYPVSNTLPLAHTDMPAPVVLLYNEARDVAPVSKRAGAALARATMEALLRHLLENDTDQLIDLIDQVEPLVSRSLADLLMFVRHVGNSALHVKGEPNDSMVLVLDEETTEAFNALFVIVNRLVEELITEPARTARLVGTVPETVKAKVEQLRAKRQEAGG